MKKPQSVFLVALLGLVGASAANAGNVNDIGPSVRSALELQRSGRASAPVRPMIEAAAERSYARYLDSFTYPIPERFERDGDFATDAQR